ncbi:MAG TPA: metallophosphoesterase family protein [Ardenticatenaceae bacterium]|jgi:predicted phosphodiesterase
MRYLILSDIHANLTALNAVLEAADLSTVDQVWCLGDVIGYGPDPNECVERVREVATVCLVGNHDWAVLGKLDINDFNPEARRAVLWTRDVLNDAAADYLGGLEGRMDNVHPDFTLAHASPRHPIWEYLLYPSTAAENFPHFTTRFCLVGHTHKPVIFRQEQGQEEVMALQPAINVPLPLARAEGVRFILNPGSVGQPRDNDPRAAYTIYDDEKGTLTYFRVPYDIEATQRRMEAAGLPERLVARLEYGW